MLNISAKKKIISVLFVSLILIPFAHNAVSADELPDGPIPFIRGDVDGSQSINLTDGVLIARQLFEGKPFTECEDASDVNDDGELNITDVIYVFNYFFRSGPKISFPTFPYIFFDPTEDELSPECSIPPGIIEQIEEECGSLNEWVDHWGDQIGNFPEETGPLNLNDNIIFGGSDDYSALILAANYIQLMSDEEIEAISDFDIKSIFEDIRGDFDLENVDDVKGLLGIFDELLDALENISFRDANVPDYMVRTLSSALAVVAALGDTNVTNDMAESAMGNVDSAEKDASDKLNKNAPGELKEIANKETMNDEDQLCGTCYSGMNRSETYYFPGTSGFTPPQVYLLNKLRDKILSDKDECCYKALYTTGYDYTESASANAQAIAKKINEKVQEAGKKAMEEYLDGEDGDGVKDYYFTITGYSAGAVVAMMVASQIECGPFDWQSTWCDLPVQDVHNIYVNLVTIDGAFGVADWVPTLPRVDLGEVIDYPLSWISLVTLKCTEIIGHPWVFHQSLVSEEYALYGPPSCLCENGWKDIHRKGGSWLGGDPKEDNKVQQGWKDEICQDFLAPENELRHADVPLVIAEKHADDLMPTCKCKKYCEDAAQ